LATLGFVGRARILQKESAMSRHPAKYCAVLAALLGAIAFPRASGSDGFAALAPDVVLTDTDRAALDNGESRVQIVPGRDGHLSLTAVIRIDTTPERVIAWTAQVEALQKGHYVPEIGRFSSPPRLADLDGLLVEADDLTDLARCRPGDCGVKLSAPEIESLHDRDRAALASQFRDLLVRRATAYLASGDGCAVPYVDHRHPVDPAAAFKGVTGRLSFFPQSMRRYAEYLEHFPTIEARFIEQSFLYWSKETLGMKPITSITHFSAARFRAPHLPEAVIVAKQVYASHYKNASITVTALINDHGRRYLVYLHRSQVDAFEGLLGGLVRRVVEQRVKAEAPAVLQGLRRKLESLPPPPPIARASTPQ
jgi:hypothetical protein